VRPQASNDGPEAAQLILGNDFIHGVISPGLDMPCIECS
jgi:hypothetical protein